MTLKTITYAKSRCYVASFSPIELRLETSVGILGRRERIDKMFGLPRNDEVTAYRQNCSFFDMTNPKSEAMGEARGNDPFINFGYDGKKLYIEPDIHGDPLWETSGGYALIRNGRNDFRGEAALKSIIGANPRSMLGQTALGTIYAIIAEGRLFGKGLTSEEQRSLGKEYGLYNMVNLDGGGSSVMYLYDKRYGNSYDGRLLGKILVGYKKYSLSELPTLRKGAKGVYVHLLQRLLKGLDLDGSFGNLTRNSVIAYQTAHALKIDGVVGKQTWGHLVANRR